MESTRAILLRRSRFSDTSLIISWLSPERGHVKTIAKGALRPRSPFAGRLDLFYECEIGYVLSRKSDLHTLREIQILDSFEQIRSSWMKTRVASYFAELADLASEPEHPAHELYSLLRAALAYVNEKEASSRLLLRFERKLAESMGIGGPSTESALAHGATVELARILGRMPPGRDELLHDLGNA
jgi:DNA repair protein RecO (recombination protein O)